MNKINKEWNVNAPWGKIAMASWGEPSRPPVLLVHGYMDTVATFIPLLEKLPDDHFYVGFDFPGHGRSDTFPLGIQVTHPNMIEAMRLVVEHMRWNTFVMLSHSKGFLFGISYNAVFPGKISKMINIDNTQILPRYFHAWEDTGAHIILSYINFYEDYNRYMNNPLRKYTYYQVASFISKSRSISNKQAQSIISRCLVPAGKGRYTLSWDPRMKTLISIEVSPDILFNMTTKNAPPMLNIVATLQEVYDVPKRCREMGMEMWDQIGKTIPNYFVVYVTGEHNLHITNTVEVASHVSNFLKRDFKSSLTSKL